MTPQFRKSSYSGSGSNCVEAGAMPGKIAVRDTKDREGGTLEFDTMDWAAFLTMVR
jgi:hypothetical protein